MPGLYLPARYREGPARRPGDSEYPDLWRGLQLSFDGAVQGRGMNARDLSGFGNHGTLNGSMDNSDWVVGPRGYALDFDGSNDSVSTGFNAITNYPFTLSVRMLATVAGGIGISIADVDSNVRYFAIGLGSVFYPWVTVRSDTGEFSDLDTVTAYNSVWVFLACVFESATVRKLYVNGSLINTFTGSVLWPAANPDKAALGVGCRSSEFNFLTGRIDCGSIHSRALAPPEILALYQGASAHTPRKRMRWKAAGGSALTLSVSDSITMGESRSMLAGLGKADALTLAEAIAKSVEMSKTDSVALADAKELLCGLGKTDACSFSDTLSKLVGKNITDGLTLADQIEALLLLIIAITDAISLSDSTVKSIGKNTTDTVALSEALAKAVTKQFTDALGLTDLSYAQIVAITAAVNIWIARNRGTVVASLERSKTFCVPERSTTIQATQRGTTWTADPS